MDVRHGDADYRMAIPRAVPDTIGGQAAALVRGALRMVLTWSKIGNGQSQRRIAERCGAFPRDTGGRRAISRGPVGNHNRDIVAGRLAGP
jgi:hypothetical protein